jgi:NhaP-type Na+/H+ and K+/H+ antiporter
MTIMLPRGLAAAVLASLPFTSGIPDSEVFPEIAFMVILTTIIICTVGVFIYQNKKSIKEKIEAYNHRNATKDEFN